MDGDFPWIYVAMIFIAFVSWVKSRLDEAAKIRQQRSEAKGAAKRAKRESKPVETTSPYRTRDKIPRSTAPASASVPAPVVPEMESKPVPTSFREFFEMVKEAATEPASPPPLPKASPPVPVAAPVVPEARRTVAPPSAAKATVAAPRVSRLLRSRAGLREAIVLKEILDPPVSMRE